MATFRSLAAETVWLDVDGRLERVEPGETVTVSDTYAATHYVQVGAHGEIPQWEIVEAKPKKAAKPQKEI